jgi:hypothetical protein
MEPTYTFTGVQTGAGTKYPRALVTVTFPDESIPEGSSIPSAKLSLPLPPALLAAGIAAIEAAALRTARRLLPPAGAAAWVVTP